MNLVVHHKEYCFIETYTMLCYYAMLMEKAIVDLLIVRIPRRMVDYRNDRIVAG